MTVERKTFVGSVDGRNFHEVGPNGQAVVRNRAFVIPPAARIARLKAHLRRPLKWLVRGLYCGPLFVVAALVAATLSPATSDRITVAFVCLLVTFFTLLCPYLVLSAVAFRVGDTGRARLRPPFSRSGSPLPQRDPARSLASDPAPAPPHRERIRLRGTVVELEPRPAEPGPVVVDGWLPDADPPSRVTEAVDFAVVGADGRVAVIECQTAPTLIATPTTRATADMLDTLREPSRQAFAAHGPVSGAESSDWVTLRAGDEVEVTGAVDRALPNVRSFELSGRTFAVPGGSALGPYRGAPSRHGVLLCCDGDDAPTLRKLSAAP
jgi:hypothetical protein